MGQSRKLISAVTLIVGEVLKFLVWGVPATLLIMSALALWVGKDYCNVRGSPTIISVAQITVTYECPVPVDGPVVYPVIILHDSWQGRLARFTF